jgi:hypothetical protein
MIRTTGPLRERRFEVTCEVCSICLLDDRVNHHSATLWRFIEFCKNNGWFIHDNARFVNGCELKTYCPVHYKLGE